LSNKFGLWKRCFCHSANRFQGNFDFPTVSTSGKSGSELRKVYDNSSFAVGFGDEGPNGTT